MTEDAIIHFWHGEARFGQPATVIGWLHDKETWTALTTARRLVR